MHLYIGTTSHLANTVERLYMAAMTRFATRGGDVASSQITLGFFFITTAATQPTTVAFSMYSPSRKLCPAFQHYTRGSRIIQVIIL